MNTNNGTSQRNDTNEPRRLGIVKNQSGKLGIEPYKAIDPNSQRENNNRETFLGRRDIAGGILSQLIEDSEDQLAYLEKQAVRLKKRIKSFKELQESLSINQEKDLESN